MRFLQWISAWLSKWTPLFVAGVAVVFAGNKFVRRNRGVEVTITAVNGSEG